MAGSPNYAGLLACRFFLGLFDVGCMSLFAVMTGQWYRLVEQPFRVAIWYSTNGAARIASSVLSYGLCHIHYEPVYPWQM